MHPATDRCQQGLGKQGTGGIVLDDVILDVNTALRGAYGRKERWEKIAAMRQEQNVIATTVDDFSNEIDPCQ